MADDFLLREQFITNPSHVLCEYVHGEQLSDERATLSNRLIYAVMSDRPLLTWFHEYADKQQGRVPSGDQFIAAFTDAVIQQGSASVVHALVACASSNEKLYGFDEDLLHFVMNLGAVRAGRRKPGGTDSDAAAAGVAAGDTPVPVQAQDVVLAGPDGTLTAVTWTTYVTGGGTGTGTGGGTGTDPFTRSPFTTRPGTNVAMKEDEFGPDYVMTTLDALTDYSFRLKEAGALGPG